jgi:hypothetical protein
MFARRAQRCKTDKFRYEAAGRAELGRDGASNEKLGTYYDCRKDTIIQLTKLFRANHDDFRMLEIDAAEQDYKLNSIQVSAGSVRTYLMRRRRKY